MDYIVKINGIVHRMSKEKFLLAETPKEILHIAPKAKADERNRD
jgi:hypothetical protein